MEFGGPRDWDLKVQVAARVKPVISASLPGEFFAGEMAEVDGSVGNEGLETYKFGASLALRRVRSASRTHLSRFLCRKACIEGHYNLTLCFPILRV